MNANFECASKEMLHAAQGLADILGFGTVERLDAGTMAEDERGWSGNAVIRRQAFFADGSSIPMIFKYAQRKERCVMKRLTEQKLNCSPAAFSADTDAEELKWMAMEDLGQPRRFDLDDAAQLCLAAKALASIHAANMGRRAEMPWLPVADEAYWKTVVTQLSVDHFERKMEQNASFRSEFGKYLPELRATGNRFARDMTALSREKACMTLTHGDLQLRDGAHLYNCGGKPYIIDFGFCRYAPFYIDLAGWFTVESLRLYYDALCAEHVSLRYEDFMERARTAFRYTGFIYLCPSVLTWREGAAQTEKRLLQSLEIIRTGDFPEKKIHYADDLLARLIEKRLG